jgi:ribonucleoside-diphosphate reductase alpha chain
MTSEYGPTLEISKAVDAEKYCGAGESFEESINRFAAAASAGDEEFRKIIKEILLSQRFLPAGRVRSAIGSPRVTTASNCFVIQEIEDSMKGIMRALEEASLTMKMGGGVGYDFSTLRPKGERIRSIDGASSGPVSFMEIFDAACRTISSAGNRRGAQMGVLRVDHPDIEEFVHAKKDEHSLTAFNISVAITDKFMEAVEAGEKFPLKWKGRTYRTVDARSLYDEILRNNWDWGEPGVLFIDQINRMNNLYYCEDIAATNPCGEQPLPPWGACLLGSFNLVKYVRPKNGDADSLFKWDEFQKDIPHIVRMMDNIIDIGTYPIQAQKDQARLKRRMGLGITGFASALTMLDVEYGSLSCRIYAEAIMSELRRWAYEASTDLAKERGPFKAYNAKYLDSEFVKSLPSDIQAGIQLHGIRNSHLISLAPCGTISLAADNISSGIEPPFALNYTRAINTAEGPKVVEVDDWALRELGIKSKTSGELTMDEHLSVLLACQPFVDSSISKKGLTTYRTSGKRKGIMEVKEGSSCEIMPDGSKSCE